MIGLETTKIITGRCCKRVRDTIYIAAKKIVEQTITNNKTMEKEINLSTRPIEKMDLMPIALADVSYIQKVRNQQQILGGVITFLSGIGIAIINPLVNYNFKRKEANGNRWLNMHLIQSGTFAGGILLNSKSKGKKYYLKSNVEGKKMYELDFGG